MISLSPSGDTVQHDDMIKEGENLVKLTDLLDESKKKLEEAEEPFKKEMRELGMELERLQKKMEEATKVERNEVETREKLISEGKEKLIKGWDLDEKRIELPLDGGHIDLKTTKGFEIRDEESLMERCKSFKTPPYKPGWKKKELVTLIETGVIPEEEAVVTTKQHIAVTRPKKEVVMSEDGQES